MDVWLIFGGNYFRFSFLQLFLLKSIWQRMVHENIETCQIKLHHSTFTYIINNDHSIYSIKSGNS